MRRTEVLQGLRLMKFEDVYGKTHRGELSQSEAVAREWKSGTLPAFKRLTERAEAVITGSYLAEVNTRRVRRALESLFGGAIGKAGPEGEHGFDPDRDCGYDVTAERRCLQCATWTASRRPPACCPGPCQPLVRSRCGV